MRAAGAIYVVSAAVVLSIVVYLFFVVGAGTELLALALLSGALLVLARGLLGGKSSVTTCAIGLSSILALGFLLLPLYSYVQRGWSGVTVMWPLLALFVAFAIAHSFALAFLFRAKSGAA
jgi:hypothetical protein